MKTINRISKVMKIVGVVLVLVSLVIGLYALASNGANRNTLLNAVRDAGGSTSFLENFTADTTIYRAMAAVANDKDVDVNVRAERIKPMFSGYQSRIESAQSARSEQAYTNAIQEFEASFDFAGFNETYSQMEDQSEARAIAKAIEELDAYQPSKPAKPGKPVLKPASCEPDMKNAYEALVAEHGEEAGTYVEFLETVALLMKEAESAPAPKDFVTKNMTWDMYIAKLPEVKSAERADEEGNLLDSFAALCAKKAAGEAVDFTAFFDETYDALSAQYPDEIMPGKGLYVTTLLSCFKDVNYDGTSATTIKKLSTAGKSEQDAGAEKIISNYCVTVVKSTDEQSPVPGFAIVWTIVSLYVILFITGIVLLVLSRIIRIVLTKRLLAARKDAGVDEDSDILLRVEHLKQYFRSGKYVNRAVDDISFFVKKGEVFGLVGESGCGKTTTGRTIINLYDPTDGDVYFQGLRISSTEKGLPILLRQKKNELRAAIDAIHKEDEEKIKENPEKREQIIAQSKAKIKEMVDAHTEDVKRMRDNALESSVEKSKCVEMYRKKRQAELTAAFEEESKKLSGKALEDLKKKYDIEMKVAAKDNIMTRMQMIFQDPIASINPRMTVREIIAEGLVIRGVTDKEYINNKVNEMLELVGLVPEHADRYPHEFSGGQRQRIGIARAIVMEPDLIIADEPISALDVSIQAQVINLLNDLRNKMGLTILFIAHNLSVVKYFSDRIAVMYFGKIMELTTSDELFEHPLHPYTKSLLSAIPYPDPHYEKSRVRVEYNPAKVHDYKTDKPSLREITPGHYIHCNDAEFAQYKKELGL